MEEILASIRQMIADDPSSDQSEPVIEANPLVPSKETRPAEPRPPLADRLSDVLKGGSLPPTSPLGSKRPLSFDQDLADMFDENAPANGSSVIVPKPDIRVSAALSPVPAKPFVPPMAVTPPNDKATVTPPSDRLAVIPPNDKVAAVPPAGKDETIGAKEVAKLEGAKPAAVADGAAALPLPPQLAPSAAIIPPLPFGGGEKPVEVAPSTTFGFPPLRKTSFYPPQPKAPVRARPATTGGFFPSQPAAPDPAPTPEPPAAASPDTAEPTGEAARVPRGIGSDVSGDADPFTAGPLSSEPPQPASVRTPFIPKPPRFRAADWRFSPFATSDSSVASEPSGASPAAAPLSPAPGSAARTPFGTPPADAPFATAPDARPIEPRLHADPFSQTVRPDSGYAAQSRLGAEPVVGSDAAHQALDALALGLAASAAHASVPPEPVSPAIPLTPVLEDPDADVRVHPVPSTLPAPLPVEATAPVNRTLEDAVADMLRPMLQQWVAENMPRIIERALRTEVAQIVKPGSKPPGA
jgi:hypothetical protein